MHVLFVCTGNICRSPLAERLTVAYAASLAVPNLTVASAGTRALVAHPIHHDAAATLESLGGTSSNFSARRLSSRIASAADLILTMTRQQRDIVLELAPHQLRRTFTLSEASRLVSEHDARSIADLAELRSRLEASEVSDVPDPIGRSPEYFEMVGRRIADLLPPILELCRRPASAPD